MSTATSSNTTATNARTHHPSSSSTTSNAQPATQACAACKYQRRKCNPDCTLAPYFPADQQRQFLNAHRLFGVSNILKIIRHLDPVQRAEAMRSIIFQSNARAHDPVGGCYRIILELERQLERDSAELALVLRQLAICRAQAQAALSPGTADLGINPNLILSTGDDTGSDAIYGSHQSGLVLPMQQQQQQPQQQQQQYYDYFYYEGGGDNPNGDHHNNNNHSISNSNGINGSYNNAGVEMEVATSSVLSLHPQQCRVDEEAVKPLVDMFEVRQAFPIGDDDEESAKNFAATVAEPFQCSGKIELKEELNPIEDVPEHDLKGAASLFTLTNCTSSSI
ncbi:LOB domain-containing protein 11-like [Phoenix dactylifera]|uniref:LOB domain-containing protein 11-like n=1 Tax=Phoenix dactylifera TaxID=42345 RepID=A0A8B7BKN3_PHODC|nr:LOB domain-containing protein 11-like [Phoenix dactylifera]